ncbi:MAG: GNAT family N-acetyltransferase [Nocardioidaceae bacterium]
MTRFDPAVLKADGLVLRRAGDADAEAALRMLSDPDVVQWMPADVQDLETARGWCRRSADWDGHATFVVVDDAEVLLGNITLVNIDVEQATGEIGYRVGPWARNRGVATSAVELATDWAFEAMALRRITLFHSVANPASCRVATKCGYQMEGTLRSAMVAGDGRRYDLHVHGRLPSDRR